MLGRHGFSRDFTYPSIEFDVLIIDSIFVPYELSFSSHFCIARFMSPISMFRLSSIDVISDAIDIGFNMPLSSI